MKLQTAIKPRRDGTVIVQGLDGKSHVFLPDDAGDLVCDIAHEATVAHLLSLDLFMPADEADFDRALALTSGNHSPDDEEDGFDSEGNGLPIEANTPPAASASPAVASAQAPATRAPTRAGSRKNTPPAASASPAVASAQAPATRAPTRAGSRKNTPPAASAAPAA